MIRALDVAAATHAGTREALRHEPSRGTLLGSCSAMRLVQGHITAMARSSAPVLITGETGTGKELVARALHARSGRSGPFVAVNCAAFPETLLEAELFGHERGAFTGALRARDGRFRSADGGTLLLDEIGEMSMFTQAKLLRVVQEGAVEPLGSDRTFHCDVRIVSATHRDLDALIQAGRFRQDLYYRLQVLGIHIPPLRDRGDDIELLLRCALEQCGHRVGVSPEITPRAWAALTRHSWPGNVRELQHAIEHAVIVAAGEPIELCDLPSCLAREPADSARAAPEPRRLTDAVREFERAYLLRAVESAGGRRGEAARQLGISRKTLWKKLRDHRLDEGRLDEPGLAEIERQVPAGAVSDGFESGTYAVA